MVTRIEISPSSHATCKSCGKKIGIGTPRGIIEQSQSYGTSKSYLCYKCTNEKLLEQIEWKKHLIEELDKTVKEHSKEIIAMEL